MYQCPNFSNAPFLVAFFRPLSFANKTRAVPCLQGKCSVRRAFFLNVEVVKLNYAEVAEREEPGEPGSSLPGRQLEKIGNVRPMAPTIVTNEVTKKAPYKWPNENG